MLLIWGENADPLLLSVVANRVLTKLDFVKTLLKKPLETQQWDNLRNCVKTGFDLPIIVQNPHYLVNWLIMFLLSF